MAPVWFTCRIYWDGRYIKRRQSRESEHQAFYDALLEALISLAPLWR